MAYDGEVNRGFDDEGFHTIDLRTQTGPRSQRTSSEADDTNCGWGSFRPLGLQRFRTAKWALFWLCWAGAIQGMVVNGFVNVVITTIERRFGLRSMETGVIAGGYDMASFLCLAPVTYLGGRRGASKPRWLGWGVLVLGLGSLLFALPHFLIPHYRVPTADLDDLCVSNRTEHWRCKDDASNDAGWALAVFIVAQLLHGAGSTPLFTLGVTYIDENVSKKMSSMYLGMFYTMTVVGPALGYVLGGQMLNIYTDFLTVDPMTVGITPQNSVWVGAWWIGFIATFIICIVIAVPLIAFPHELPGAAEIRASKVSEAHEGTASRSAAFSALRELPKAAMALLRNPTFIFLNLAGASEGMLISGFAAFLPKLIENQFAVNAANAALLLGLITVPAGGGGTFLGGWLVKRWRLSCAGIIKLCVAASVAAAAFTFCFILTCPDYAFAGVTVPYKGASLPGPYSDPLQSVCNVECKCGGAQYAPVCAADGVVYYSACHAGCTTRIRRPGKHDIETVHLFGDCGCVHTNDTLPEYQFEGSEKLPYEAINSTCNSTCPYLWVFVALAFGIMLFTFLATMPALAATLRCVREDQRSFALGIQWIKVRLLGTIPAPLIFGFLIDLACSYWKKTCDVTGACLLYDNVNMSRYMLAIALIGKICSIVFFFFSWWFYKPPSVKNNAVVPTVELVEEKSQEHLNGYCNPALDHAEHL